MDKEQFDIIDIDPWVIEKMNCTFPSACTY